MVTDSLAEDSGSHGSGFVSRDQATHLEAGDAARPTPRPQDHEPVSSRDAAEGGSARPGFGGTGIDLQPVCFPRGVVSPFPPPPPALGATGKEVSPWCRRRGHVGVSPPGVGGGRFGRVCEGERWRVPRRGLVMRIAAIRHEAGSRRGSTLPMDNDSMKARLRRAWHSILVPAGRFGLRTPPLPANLSPPFPTFPTFPPRPFRFLRH